MVKSSYKKAMYLSIVAGILLLVAGITGVATWESLKDVVTENISDSTAVVYAFMGLILLASLGGILVIIGGISIGKDNPGLGRLLITIGVGTGIIGLIIMIVTWSLGGSIGLSIGFILVLLGIVLSVVARSMAKD